MSLLPPQASFAEVVQEAFVRLRGKGLMLGALDNEVLRAWAETGVPSEVVVAGLQRAVERMRWDAGPGQGHPKTLRACRPEVEAHIDGWRRRVVGAGALAREGTGQLEENLRALVGAQPAFSKVVETLWRRGVLRRANPRDAVVAALLRKLPFKERVTLLRAERLQMVEEASAVARTIRRRQLRAAWAARALGVKG